MYIALLLALFTIFFGTRHLDVSERHEGMVAAIAFESIIKLVALTAVGLFITFGLYDGFADIVAKAEQAELIKPLLNPEGSYNTWASFSFLSALAEISGVAIMNARLYEKTQNDLSFWTATLDYMQD